MTTVLIKQAFVWYIILWTSYLPVIMRKNFLCKGKCVEKQWANFPFLAKLKYIAVWCLTSWPAWFVPYYVFLHRMVHNVPTVLSTQILHLKNFLFFKCLPSSCHLSQSPQPLLCLLFKISKGDCSWYVPYEASLKLFKGYCI